MKREPSMHLCPAPALPCSDCSKRRQTSKACLPIVLSGRDNCHEQGSGFLRWDELCYHDPEKLNDILRRTGLRKGLRILDIGCGTGVLESYLLPYSPLQIVGVDISPGMIEKARSKYATPIVDFRCQDVRDIRGKSFDYIIAYSVFPHFQEPEKLISHLAGLLPVGGKLVVCHSESRDRINGHHDKHAGKLSEGLPPVEELARMLSPFFTVSTMEDSDRLYMISATRKQTF